MAHAADKRYPPPTCTSVGYSAPPQSAGQASGEQAASTFATTEIEGGKKKSPDRYVRQSGIQLGGLKEQKSISANRPHDDYFLSNTNCKSFTVNVATDSVVSAIEPAMRSATSDHSESNAPSVSPHDSSEPDEIVVLQEEVEEDVPAELQLVRRCDNAEQLLLIPDQLEPPPPGERPTYEFVEFVSDDPAENADNNAVEWEVLRCLSSDSERYHAVRKRWRNTEIPDPHRCLTYYGYRRRLVRASLQRMGLVGRGQPEPTRRGRGLKRTLSATGWDGRPAGKRPRLAAGCAFMADWLMEQGRTLETAGRVVPSLEAARRRMNDESVRFCRQLAFNHQLTPAQRDRELLQLQRRQFRELQQEFGPRTRRAAHRLAAAKAETETFFRFYTGLNNTDAGNASWLTEHQCQEVKDFEDYIVSQDRVYGHCLDEDL